MKPWKVQNDIACESPGIRLLCPTCWTVRILISVSENYEVLRDTWSLAQHGSDDSEMHGRIGGVAKQMENLDFLFGIELGRMVLNMADNLSAALQGSAVSVSEGQNLMSITTLESTRSEESFTDKTGQCQQFGVAEPNLPQR